MTDRDETTYLRGRLSLDQLRDEVARFWADAESAPELQEALEVVGFGSSTLPDADRADLIKIRVGSSGADPVSVLLVISLAPTANRMLKDLWATVLLPRIRRRWGDDAIGDEINRHSP